MTRSRLDTVYYTLFINGSPYFANQIGANGLVIFDRTPSTTYTVKVRAAGAAGNFVDSNTESVTTPPVTDFAPPTAPTI